MKILMVAPTPFYTDRGCSIRIFEVASALQRRGHQVKIVTYHLGNTPPGLDVERTMRVPWYHKLEAGPSWHKPYIDLLLLLKCLAVNRRFRGEVVHGHLHEGCLVGWFVAKLYGLPLVFDFQGSMTEEVASYGVIGNRGLLHNIFHITESLIDRLADRILVAASASKKLLVERFYMPAERIGTLLDGVGVPGKTHGAEGAALRQELGIPANARIVAYAGSLTTIENIDWMLRAIQSVLVKVPEAYFLILGGPENPEHAAQARALGIAKRVLFAGVKPYAEVPRYLALAEITWSAKLQAEANGKLYGYMWCHKPVVAFNHSINREILGELGYYPRKESPEALGDELVATLHRSPQELKDRGQVLRERVDKYFSWDARAAELEAEYKTLHVKPRRPLFWHWPALVVALVVGFLCVAPQAYFALHDPSYQGIHMTGQDGEEHYLARMQEIREGHWLLGNTFLPDKNEPTIAPGGGEAVAVAIGLPFGLDTANTEVFGKFFFPALIVLAFYGLAYSIARSRLAATLAAAAVPLGYNLISGPGPWLELARGMSSSTAFLAYARPVNPEVSGLWLILGLLLTYRVFITHKARILERVALGLLLATAFYISLYIYTFLGLMLFLLMLWFVYERRWKDMRTALYLGVVGLVGLVPYLINYQSLIHAAAYADAAARTGIIASHMSVIGLWAPIILLCSLFALPKRYAPARIFFSTAAVSILLLSNQQVLSGHELQVDHYHWYITKPLVLFIAALYGAYAIERLVNSRSLRLSIAALGVVVLVYNAALVQIHSYQARLPYARATQSYVPALATLTTLSPHQVVWAPRDLSLFIPIYTTHDAPNNEYAMYYVVPQSYLEQRLYLEYRLRGIMPAQALATMRQERADIAKRLFAVYWRDQAGSYDAIPDSLLAQYAQGYAKVYREPLQDLYKMLGITVVWEATSSSAL